MKKAKERKPVIRCSCRYSWKNDVWNRKYKVNMVQNSMEGRGERQGGRCTKCNYFRWFLTRVDKKEKKSV